jgi:hypothetical protein
VFDRTEHRIAAISGWLIFAASIPYTLWALLWVVSGLAVLHIALNTTTSAEGRYGFLTWIGFWSAWPYVVFARYAWRKQPQHDDTVSLLSQRLLRLLTTYGLVSHEPASRASLPAEHRMRWTTLFV